MRYVKHTGPKNGRWPMIGCMLVLLIMAALSGVSVADSGNSPTRIEVFTTAEQEVVGVSAIDSKQQYSGIELQVYRLDGIQRVESELSENLSGDPELARRLALQRIQQLDRQTATQMQQAAVGLAKALQYGVDRYPAIVFDGEVVIYGLTDLSIALDQYRTWREGARS